MKMLQKNTLPTITPSPVFYFLPFFLALIVWNAPAQSSSSAIKTQEEQDKGGEPWVLDIERATVENLNYRVAKWTGENLQMVLMTLHPGEEIDLEKHDSLDQFIRLEQGEARVRMGTDRDNLSFDEKIHDDWAAFIPAGYFHYVKNTGNTDLKLYTIYSPAAHPKGIINHTYEDAREYHEAKHQH